MPEQWMQKGERDDKYGLYIEAYALDYVKKKENLSGLSLYGMRQAGNRERILVYGVSNTVLDGDLFSPYEIITGLRVRERYEKNTRTIEFEMEDRGTVHRIRGYYVFYEDNPIMKQWLIREKRYVSEPILEACEVTPVPKAKKETAGEKGTAERVADFGLIAVLLALLSVVIDTLNSPLKMSKFAEHLQQIQKMLKR